MHDFEYKGAKYTYDWDAIATIEKHFKKPFTALGEVLAEGLNADGWRVWLEAGLKAEHGVDAKALAMQTRPKDFRVLLELVAKAMFGDGKDEMAEGQPDEGK